MTNENVQHTVGEVAGAEAVVEEKVVGGEGESLVVEALAAVAELERARFIA